MAPRAISIRAVLADGYGLTVRACQQARRAWRVETDRGVYALKRALPPLEALFLHQAETHLAAHHFTRFPRLVAAISGAPEYVSATGERFMLRVWLPGSPPALDREHPLDLACMARAAAEMHVASAGFHGLSGSRSAWDSWPDLLAARMEDLRRFSARKGRFGRFLRAYREAIPTAMDEGKSALALAGAAGYSGLAKEASVLGGLCHGDLGANNALVHGNAVYLIDFDRAEMNVFPSDLAMLIRRVLCAQEWEIDLAAELLQTYQRVRPLSPREIRVTAALLHWPQPVWRLGYQYLVEKLDRPEQFFLSRLWHWTSKTGKRQAFLRYCREKLWQVGR